jgi:hypothetical protein
LPQPSQLTPSCSWGPSAAGTEPLAELLAELLALADALAELLAALAELLELGAGGADSGPIQGAPQGPNGLNGGGPVGDPGIPAKGLRGGTELIDCIMNGNNIGNIIET